MRNTNDLPMGFARIAQESRVFYLLGFYPPEGQSARKWRKLRVEVTRPGLTVRARRGYTLGPATAGPVAARRDKKEKQARTVDPAVTRALDSAHDFADIPLRAMAYVLEPRPNEHRPRRDRGRVRRQPHRVRAGGELALGTPGRDASSASGRDSGRGFRHDDTVELSERGAGVPGWRAHLRPRVSSYLPA